MKSMDPWRKELAIAAVMLAFGMFALPAAIYLVGTQLIGPYSEDSGMLMLAEHIWSDLLALVPGAWILVLSPYVVMQLLRLTIKLARAPSRA